jgi:putative glutamine amidotransferase
LTAPLIGVSLGRRINPHGYSHLDLPEAYTRAIVRAGGWPVLVPLDLEEAALAGLLSRLDGVLLSGGGDVHPQRYRSRSHPLVAGVDPDRDRTEIALAHLAAGEGKPLFGICRGLQVINVALGGSLYEDLLDQYPQALQHSCFPDHPRDHLAHPVRVQPNTRLAGILGGPSSPVNSMHHQGIRDLAPGLQAAAFAPDGLVEAVELFGHPFGLAVQWHPECLQEHEPMQRLFRTFVEACEFSRS